MKKFSIILFALALVLTSCGPNAVTFNETLVSYVDQATNSVQKLQDVVSNGHETNDYSTLTDVSKSTIDSLNTLILKVDALEAPKDGEDFKASVSGYFKSLVAASDAYAAYAALPKDATDEQIEAVNQQVDKSEDIYIKLFAVLNTKQRSFAKKNNMELK